MEKKKWIKIIKLICAIFVFLWAIFGLINAYQVVSLSKTTVVVLNCLAICAWIGFFIVNLKQLIPNDFRVVEDNCIACTQ